jgi:hypothetical protein
VTLRPIRRRCGDMEVFLWVRKEKGHLHKLHQTPGPWAGNYSQKGQGGSLQDVAGGGQLSCSSLSEKGSNPLLRRVWIWMRLDMLQKSSFLFIYFLRNTPRSDTQVRLVFQQLSTKSRFFAPSRPSTELDDRPVDKATPRSGKPFGLVGSLVIASRNTRTHCQNPPRFAPAGSCIL